MMTTTRIDPKAVTEALQQAREVAKLADPVEDWGTCNLDSVVLRFPKGTRKAAIREMLGKGEDDQPLSGWMWDRCWFIDVGALGQAERRSKMTEAAHRYLTEKLEPMGIDVRMYYQMD